MRTLPSPVALFLGLALAAVPAAAAEKSVLGVSVEAESEIAALHRDAEDRIAMNDFRGAIALYQEILLIEPDDAVAYARMGHSYLILGDPGRAADAFQAALDIDPDNVTAQLGLRKIADPDIDLSEIWTGPAEEEDLSPPAIAPPDLDEAREFAKN